MTDRVTLLAAARAIGFGEVTVGAVTARVGVKYSTFYRHFPSLDALLTALVDEVCDEVELPDPELPWRTVVADTCAALFELLERYPGLAEVALRLPALPVGTLRFYRSVTDALLGAGLSGDQAALGAVTALEAVSISRLTTPGVGRTLAERQETVAGQEMLSPAVRAATAGIAADSARDWTMRKVDLLVRGLASVAEPQASAPVTA